MAYEEDELEKEEADLSPIEDLELGNDEETPVPKLEQLPLDEDTDNEVEASEDIAKEELAKKSISQEINENADELLATLKPGQQSTEIPVEPPSRLDRYQNFINEYRKLQDQRKNSDLVAGLMASGGKIGQSMAGKYSGKFDPDMSGVNLIKQMGERPVQDLEQQQIVSSRGIQLQGLQNANDPKSPQSRLIRDYLKTRLGIELGDDVSAADAQMLLKTIGKPASGSKQFQTKAVYNPTTKTVEMRVFDTSTGKLVDDQNLISGFAQKTVTDPRTKEVSNFNPALGAVTKKLTGPESLETAAGAQEPELSKANLDTRTIELVDDTRKALLDDTKDDRTALNAAKSIGDILDTGEALDGDILRLIQNKFARASGERGAMTEQDVAPYGGRQAVLDRISRNVKNWTSGKIPDTDREFLRSISKAMVKRSQEDINNRANFFTTNVHRDIVGTNKNLKNVKPEAVKKLLGVDTLTSEEEKVKVRYKATGQVGLIPKKNLKKALASKKYEEVK